MKEELLRQLLNEFDYDKNKLEDIIEFLQIMLFEAEKILKKNEG